MIMASNYLMKISELHTSNQLRKLFALILVYNTPEKSKLFVWLIYTSFSDENRFVHVATTQDRSIPFIETDFPRSTEYLRFHISVINIPRRFINMEKPGIPIVWKLIVFCCDFSQVLLVMPKASRCFCQYDSLKLPQ
jgi:hypothetical protein